MTKSKVEKKLLKKIKQLTRLVTRLQSENGRLRKHQQRIQPDRSSVLIFPAKLLQPTEKSPSTTPNRPSYARLSGNTCSK